MPQKKILDKLNEVWLQQLLVSFFIVATAVFLFQSYISADLVLSSAGHDTANQFLAWRTFGFSQLKTGHLPLWNPHLFSGAPFFAGFQSALLYPFNFLFLILPAGLAISLSFVMHTILFGLFTQYWMASKRLHPIACGLSALSSMLGGAFFLHIYAGHLSNVCTMAWAPLLFWMSDKLLNQNFKKISLGTFLAGAFAVAVQILAGHPQYFFYTMVSLALYSLFKIIFSDVKAVNLLNWAPVLVGGILLSALQLIGGVLSNAESVRSSGVSLEFASMFSFPPENLITVVAPQFFGDLSLYWGRSYLWEMSLFIGVSGFILAIYGAAEQVAKKKWVFIATAAAIFLLALGKSTFLFSFLYNYVPGFSSFRGISKFIFVLQLIFAVFVGVGADKLLTGKADEKKWGIGIICFGLLLLILSFAVSSSDWKSFILARLDLGESYFAREILQDQKALNFLQQNSFLSIFWASVVSLFLGCLFYLKNRNKYVVYFIFCTLFVELTYFCSGSLAAFDPKSNSFSSIENLAAAEKQNYRLLNTASANDALLNNYYDIWGMDPGILKRYAEFITWSQGGNPDQANQYINFRGPHKLYKMLRLKYAVLVDSQQNSKLVTLPEPLPQVFLINKYRVAQDRNEVFKALNDPQFDPSREAVLETEPLIKPEGAEGRVTIVAQNSDEIILEAEISKPGILIITDNYSKYWRAISMKTPEQTYDVLPANYILKAVPLAAGSHKIKIAYRPWWFNPAALITVISWLTFLFLMILFFKNKSRQVND